MNIIYALFVIAFVWLLALEVRHRSFVADSRALIKALTDKVKL